MRLAWLLVVALAFAGCTAPTGPQGWRDLGHDVHLRAVAGELLHVTDDPLLEARVVTGGQAGAWTDRIALRASWNATVPSAANAPGAHATLHLSRPDVDRTVEVRFKDASRLAGFAVDWRIFRDGVLDPTGHVVPGDLAYGEDVDGAAADPLRIPFPRAGTLVVAAELHGPADGDGSALVGLTPVVVTEDVAWHVDGTVWPQQADGTATGLPAAAEVLVDGPDGVDDALGGLHWSMDVHVAGPVAAPGGLVLFAGAQGSGHYDGGCARVAFGLPGPASGNVTGRPRAGSASQFAAWVGAAPPLACPQVEAFVNAQPIAFDATVAAWAPVSCAEALHPLTGWCSEPLDDD